MLLLQIVITLLAGCSRWLEVGKGITNTCHESYDRSDTKLGPEAFRFSEAIEARALKQNERSAVLFYSKHMMI